MRILSFFFKILVLVGIFGAFVYFAGGDLWLQVGTYNFKTDVEQLPLYNRRIADFTAECQHSPQSSDQSTPLGFEIRFLNDRDYVIEVVCSLIENAPIEIKRGSLPPLITKLPGSAGFYYPIEQTEVFTSAVRLKSINKEIGIALAGDTLKVGSEVQPLIQGFPKAECNAFGYFCCSAGSEVGKGDRLTKVVTDCPTVCYPQCASVAYIALFNSDPQYNQETREIPLTGNTLNVVFNYSVNPKTIQNVHINYGDGSEENSVYPDGIFTHTFTCAGACRLTVTLSATDKQGLSTIESDNSKIYIVRK